MHAVMQKRSWLAAVSVAVTSMVWVAQAHAALQNVTLDSGVQVSLDSGSGLAWRSFDSLGVGEQAGFRVATSADFLQLLTNQGYGSLQALPAGMQDATVIPGETKTVTSTIWSISDQATGAQLSYDQVPSSYWIERQTIDEEYRSTIDGIRPGGRAESIIPALTNSYNLELQELGNRYKLNVSAETITETITTPSQTIGSPLEVDGVRASLYGGDAQNVLRIAGTHVFDNSYPYAIERHSFYIGMVAAGSGYWAAAVVDNYVPTQCPVNGTFSGGQQYCGGTSSTSAYLGPESNSGFSPSGFSRRDGQYVYGDARAAGYLMVQAVPEAGTFWLMGLGLAGLFVTQRYRLRAKPVHA